MLLTSHIESKSKHALILLIFGFGWIQGKFV